MFAVVHFIESNTVEVCPKSWLLDDESAFWPSAMKGHEIYKLQIDGNVSATDWPVFKIRILYKAETFALARKKLNQAEITSDLTTDDEWHLKNRKRGPPSRFMEQFSTCHPSKSTAVQSSDAESCDGNAGNKFLS